MIKQEYSVQLYCDKCTALRAYRFLGLPNLTAAELLDAYNNGHDFRSMTPSHWRFGKDGKLYCSESCEEK